jgi:hypothetical protein
MVHGGTNDVGGSGGRGRSGSDPKWRTTQPSRDNDGGGGSRGSNLSVAAAVGNNDDDNFSENAAWGGPRLASVLPQPPPAGTTKAANMAPNAMTG